MGFPGHQTAVLLDPPRRGCDQIFLTQLLAFAPRRLVYVSCSPDTQARDLVSHATAARPPLSSPPPVHTLLLQPPVHPLPSPHPRLIATPSPLASLPPSTLCPPLCCCIYACVHACIRMYTSMRACMYTYVYTHMYMQYTRICTCMHAHMRARLHAHMHAYIHACIHAHMIRPFPPSAPSSRHSVCFSPLATR